MNMASRCQELLFGLVAGLLLIVALTFTLLLNSGTFPTTMLPFDLDDRSISYPVLKDTIDGVLNVAVNTLITIGLMILWLYLHKRTFENNKAIYIVTVYLVFMGGILVNLLTNTIKTYRGGLRPHFIAACKPDSKVVEELRQKNQSWVDLELTKTICTAEEKLDYRWSFPSGHSSEALFGAILSILIIQKIKCDLTNLWSPLWLSIKASLQFLLLTFGSWVAVSRLVDYHHHWWDVLAGSTLGTVFAVALFKWFLEPVMDHIEKLSDDPGNSGGNYSIVSYGAISVQQRKSSSEPY